jgi:uncharacterized protein YciI
MVIHFFMRLNPPRPDFATTMTPEERAMMGQHSAYLRDLLAQGKLILAGPVLDPAGVFGLGIIEVESHQEALQIAANDPSVRSGMNRYDVIPMQLGMLRGQ